MTENRPVPKGARAAFLAVLLTPVLLLGIGFRLVPLVRVISLAGSPGGTRGDLGALWGWSAGIDLIGLPFIAAAGLLLPPILRRAGRWQGALMALLLLPLFIPDTVLAATIMSVLGVTPGGPGAPGLRRAAIVVAVDILDYGGFAVALAVVLGDRFTGGSQRLLTPERIAVILVLLARSAFVLVGNMDALSTVSSSVMEPAVPASYVALWPQGGMQPAALGALWVGAIALIVGHLVVYPLVGLPGTLQALRSRLRNVGFAVGFLRFGLCSVAAVLLSMFCAISAAYPLVRGGGRARGAYLAALLLLLSMAPTGIHDYLVLRSYAMLNTFYPFLLQGILPVLLVFLLALVRRGQPEVPVHPVDRGEPYAFFYGFLAPVRKEVLALGLAYLAVIWNTVGAVGIVMSGSSGALSPVALFRALASSSSAIDGPVLLAGLLVSLPPILLLPALPMLLEVRRAQAQAR